jgi:hypothetical protein
MRGFLSDELDRFIIFMLSSYLSKGMPNEVPVSVEASAWAAVLP